MKLSDLAEVTAAAKRLDVLKMQRARLCTLGTILILRESGGHPDLELRPYPQPSLLGSAFSDIRMTLICMTDEQIKVEVATLKNLGAEA